MFQRTITVQSTSMIMAVGWFSGVKLLPLVDRTTPPYITGISDQDYLALGPGTPRQLEEAIFFFNSWKHSSSLAVHLQEVVFLIGPVRGAGE